MRKTLLLCLLLFASFGFAQNSSDRDPDFNPFELPLNYYFIDKDISKFGSQDDNKLIFVNDNKIIRLENNLLDTSFNVSFSGGQVNDFCILPDNKIVLVGSFTHVNGELHKKIVRLNADGSIDSTLNSPTGGTDNLLQVQWTTNGKLLIAGEMSNYNGVQLDKKLFRVNANGSLDQTFVFDSYYYPTLFTVQPNGRIIVSNAIGQFLRFLSNGTEDTSFNLEMLTNNLFKSIIVEPSGKIVVAGSFGPYVENGSPSNSIARLLSNGVVDTSFNPVIINDVVTGLIRQADGKYVIGGKFTTVDTKIQKHIARLNNDGTLDTISFKGLRKTDAYNMPILHQQPDGKIIFSGINYTDRAHYQNQLVTNVFRTNSEGILDPTMQNISKGFYPYGPSSVAQNINGKLIVSNSQPEIYTFNNQDLAALQQLNADGTIDQEFAQAIVANLQPTTEYSTQIQITRVEVLDNGKIILSGGFKYVYQGTTRYNFVILNPDGSIVYGQSGYSTIPVDFHIDPITGKIILIYSGSANNGIIRLLPSGLQDYSFSFNSQGVNERHSIIQLPNGKIAFTGHYNKKLYFLNNNGTYATDILTNITWCENLQVASDGSLMYFSQGLYKLNLDGTADTSFSSNLDLVGISTYNVQPDGKILTISYASNTTFKINRLFANGTTDLNFQPKLFDGNVYALKTLRYGKIFATGTFKNYNASPDNGGVVLLGENYYYLQGQNKLDNDSNGCTTEDFNFPFLKYKLTSGSETNYHIANYTGNYSIAMTEGTHTVTPVIENPSYFTITPSTVELTFPGATNPQQQNFCIVPNGVQQDVEVVVFPITPARPGFQAAYKIIYRNKGNVMASGEVKLNYMSEVMSFNNSNPTTSNTTNQLTWTYENLYPFESREIYLTFNLNTPTQNPSLNGGDILVLTGTISPETTDTIPADNTFTLNQTVVNSFDPNDKTCLEGNMVSEDYIGEYVHYLIRFENTGNGKAIKITVKDNIDVSKFDIESLTPLASSHSFVTRIEDNQVNFIFEDINLPFEDALNDGYVMFKIKLLSILLPGESFTNQAEIYFDYNFPITTNLESTLIQEILSVKDQKLDQVFIYPNPTSDYFSIATKNQISKVEIFAADGRLIQSILHPNQNKVDVSALSKGNYIIRIDNGEITFSKKLIKN